MEEIIQSFKVTALTAGAALLSDTLFYPVEVIKT